MAIMGKQKMLQKHIEETPPETKMLRELFMVEVMSKPRQ